MTDKTTATVRNGNIRINSASISEQGLATDAVTALATDAANQVVSPLRNEVAAVEKRSVDNEGDIAIDTQEIAILKRMPNYNARGGTRLTYAGKQRCAALRGRRPVYTDPYQATLVRWQVGTGLSLDSDGITIYTSQRRALCGLRSGYT